MLLATGPLSESYAAPPHPVVQLVHQKRYAEAVRAITERLAADPTDAGALVGTIDLILAQDPPGRLPEARSAAERCLAAHPDNSTCAEALGNVLAAQAGSGGIVASLGNARSIRAAFERAVRLDPTNYRARLSLLRFHLKAPFFLGGSIVRARELAMEVQRTDPDITRLMLALCAFDEDKLLDAEQYILAANLEEYELADSAHRDLLYRLAGAHLEAGRHADSIRLFSELNRRIPASEHGNYGLALVARAQGRLADASAFLDKAAAIAPKPYVYKAMGEVYQARNNAERRSAGPVSR